LSAAKLPDTSNAASNCGAASASPVAIRADRAIRTRLARLRERPIEDVADGDLRRAGEPRGHDGEAADRSGSGDQHRLAEQIAAAMDRVQRDGQRLGERELAQRHVAGDRIALPLAHHEILAKHSLHVREEARAAEEFHARAQLLPAFAAIGAAPAGVRRAHRDLVAFLDAGDIRADQRHHAGRFVPGHQRLADHEAAVAALEIVVKIGAADAPGAKAHQHLAGTHGRHRLGFDSQIFLRMDRARQHRYRSS
jgi:hypothetical protein